MDTEAVGNDQLDINKLQPVMVTQNSSLPALANELSIAQRQQLTQLKSREEKLTLLQVDLDQASRREIKTKEDVKSLERNIFMMEDDVCKARVECDDFETNISEEIEEITKIKLLNIGLQYEIEEQHSMLSEYNEKMSSFKTLVDDFYNQEKKVPEEETPTKMKDQRQTIDIPDRKSNIVCLENQIAKEKEKHRQLKNETTALNRRNASHVNRMKRILQESNLRNRQWSEDISQMEAKLKVSRNQMMQ